MAGYGRIPVRILALALGCAMAVAPALAAQATGGSVAGEPAAGVHVPPVEAPVIDPFRPPEQPWSAGNRGIEYGTEAGQIVRASAPGVVRFAGMVAGHLHVTVQHSPDLRTTAAFVGAVLVDEGDRVRPGQPIAVAGGSIHFTARRNGAYIDPMLLFGRSRAVVRLVPVRRRGASSAADPGSVGAGRSPSGRFATVERVRTTPPTVALGRRSGPPRNRGRGEPWPS